MGRKTTLVIQWIAFSRRTSTASAQWIKLSQNRDWEFRWIQRVAIHGGFAYLSGKESVSVRWVSKLIGRYKGVVAVSAVIKNLAWVSLFCIAPLAFSQEVPPNAKLLGELSYAEPSVDDLADSTRLLDELDFEAANLGRYAVHCEGDRLFENFDRIAFFHARTEGGTSVRHVHLTSFVEEDDLRLRFPGLRKKGEAVLPRFGDWLWKDKKVFFSSQDDGSEVRSNTIPYFRHDRYVSAHSCSVHPGNGVFEGLSGRKSPGYCFGSSDYTPDGVSRIGTTVTFRYPAKTAKKSEIKHFRYVKFEKDLPVAHELWIENGKFRGILDRVATRWETIDGHRVPVAVEADGGVNSAWALSLRFEWKFGRDVSGDFFDQSDIGTRRKMSW